MKNFLVASMVLCLISSVNAQQPTLIHRDTDIEKMVQAVSGDSLKAYVSTLASFGTRHTMSSSLDSGNGIGAAREWILEKFKTFARGSNGRLTATLDTHAYAPDGARIDQETILMNVVATLKGTDPNDHRVLVISGHMDSRNSDVMDRKGKAPGANDDASGVAALMECARIMSQYSFPATVVFVALCGEEQGLLGAEFMAVNAHKQDQKLIAVLNNDMIGNNQSNETNIIENNRVRIFSEGLPMTGLSNRQVSQIRAQGLENEGPSRQLARYMKEIGERYVDHLEVFLVYRPDRFLRGGDQTPFQKLGYTAVRITEMNENYDHQHQNLRVEQGIEYGDLVKFMDFEYLRKNTGLNIANLANLAKSPGVPEEVKMRVSTLSNSTHLDWQAPKNGKVKGYYVLMRETTSPVWQKKFFTSEHALNLPYSKDNYFFSVQSVSMQGNESLPVVPSVSR